MLCWPFGRTTSPGATVEAGDGPLEPLVVGAGEAIGGIGEGRGITGALCNVDAGAKCTPSGASPSGAGFLALGILDLLIHSVFDSEPEDQTRIDMNR